MSGGESKLRGDRGEEAAARWLIAHGYTIEARNYHSRYGEIDLIAVGEGVLAFVEVKLRRNGRFSQAREAVTPSKQNKIRQTALMYLSLREGEELQPRFDVAEVYGGEGASLSVEYYENAFE